MDGQSQSSQELDNRLAPFVQAGFLVVKQDKIVYITEISVAIEPALDKLIQVIQVDICPELAGEVAEWQSAWTKSGKQIIPGKPMHLIGFIQYACAVVENPVD